MATTVSPATRAGRVAPAALDRVRALASGPLLLGVLCSFLGFAWDIQWHADVGPDTFFTLPHLVLYSGTAIAGLTCLAVVLIFTAAARRGDPAAFDGTTPVFGGRYRAPLGYLIGGFGAAGFLLYGLMDEWWHGIYGFDVTLISPLHVGLILSIVVTMIGALVVFAREGRRAQAGAAAGPRSFAGAQDDTSATAAGASTIRPDGRRLDTAGWQPSGTDVGFALAASILFAFVTPTALDALNWVIGPFAWPSVATAVLYPTLLLLAVSALRRPGAAPLTAAVFTALLALTWMLAPWVTRVYAAAIGLFLRDTTTNEPVVPGLLPTFLLVAAVVVDVLVWQCRARGWSPRLGAPLAGAAAALLLVAIQPAPPRYGPGPDADPETLARIAAMVGPTRLPTLLLAPALGALAGWLGWNLGIVLRRAGEAPARQATEAAA